MQQKENNMKYIHIYKSSHLFTGIREDEVEHVLQCLQAHEKRFKKNEIIARRGDVIHELGIVVQGSVYIIKEDFWGNRTIITEIGESEIFGEVYAATGKEPLEVEIVANAPTSILFLNIRHIMQVCENHCVYHLRILENLISLLASKNLTLTRKMEHITKRSTRDKLLSYLSEMSLKSGKTTFTIPFNRQELADYLSVERSAMSRELGFMQKEGLITYEKNTFQLLIPKEDLTI